MRKISALLALLVIGFLVLSPAARPGAAVAAPAAQDSFYYIPLFYWPVPQQYRHVTVYPDNPWTWETLGMVEGKGCPYYSYRERDKSTSYWRNDDLPEEEDWAQASQGQKYVACYKGHGGSDIYADPGTPVYAIADGEIITVSTKENEDKQLNAYVEIAHNRLYRGEVYTWKTRYVHLMLNPPITTGPVKAGQLIGYVIDRKGNTHLHIEFEDLWDDCLQPCVTNPWGPESLWIDYNDDALWDAATDALPTVKSYTYLTRNTGFDSGTQFWAFSPGALVNVRSGLLRMSRRSDSEAAWMQQVIAYRIPADSRIIVAASLGNPADATRYVTVSLREPGKYLGTISCLFVLPPFSAQRLYTLEGTIPGDWNNAILEVNVQPADGKSGVLINSVAATYTAVQPAPTACYHSD
jgi:murein DD-endopeptidase MepM/ murein hydrolase activator NlpD